MERRVALSSLPHARAEIEALETNKIRLIAEAAARLDGVLPMWFGEPDVVTPQFICEAAKRALDAGHTFYGPNLGIAPLRAALAEYQTGLGRKVSADRICVTVAAINALMLSIAEVVGPGDRVVVLAPHWPHLVAIPQISGAKVSTVPLRLRNGVWSADLDELLAAITVQTKLVILNSPGNPTGFMLSRDEQVAVLEHCRHLGVWILADEVYDRISFDAPAAPSFLDHPKLQIAFLWSTPFRKAGR